MSAFLPKVSIIIPTYNRGNLIERCVRSCLAQTYQNIEVLVMDGASQDRTREIVARLCESDSRLRFHSAPDKGEVYATNDGLDRITGDIYGVQASDDYYVADAVEKAVKYLLDNPKYAGVAGDARFINQAGADLGRGMITYRGTMDKDSIRRILRNRLGSPLVHGSFFGWLRIIAKIGKFDPSYSVTPDFEFYLRLLAAGERIGCLPRVQINYMIHDDMGAWKYRAKVREQNAIIRRLHGWGALDEVYYRLVGRSVSYFGNPYRTPLVRRLRIALGARSARLGA